MSAPFPARRPPPGWGHILAMVALTGVFVYKTAWWWLDVAGGSAVPGSMTTWQWVRVVFWHAAVVAGVIGVTAMIRERRAASPPDVPSPPQSSL